MLHFCHWSRNYKPLLLSCMIMEIINWNFYDVHMHYWLTNFLAFIIILQIRFAIVDLELHTNYVPGGSESIFDFYRRVSKGTHVVPLLPGDRSLCSCLHIFEGLFSLSDLLSNYYFYLFNHLLIVSFIKLFVNIRFICSWILWLQGFIYFYSIHNYLLHSM